MSNTIDLSSFADGAVAERFNIELSRVLQNIADPNTDPKKVRKITLEVKLKADEKRDITLVDITAKSKVEPARPIETKIIMDYDSKGNVIGAELKSGAKGQMYIDQNTGEIRDDKGKNVIDYQKREVK
jgi:uncharacterized protein YuzE